MAATLQVPEGFKPDQLPAGFEPDVPNGFEPDTPVTSTATTSPLVQSLNADLSSGDPARIATAFLPLTTASNQALEVGLNQANKMQEDKAIAQAVTAEQPPKSALELAERNRQLQRQFYGTPDPPQEGIPGGDFTGILPRPDGRLGALLRTGSGVEKAIAGGIVGTEELIEGIANYMTTEQGALELGLSKTPVAPLVFLKWAKDMVQGGMVNVKDAADAYEKKDWERFGKNVVVGFGQLAGAGLAGKHGVKSGAKAIAERVVSPGGLGIPRPEISPNLARLAPETARAVTETPSPKTKVDEPSPGQTPITPEGPAPEAGVKQLSDADLKRNYAGYITKILDYGARSEQVPKDVQGIAGDLVNEINRRGIEITTPDQGKRQRPEPGGGMSTKSAADQARQAEANRKMNEDFAKEVAAVEDLRTNKSPENQPGLLQMRAQLFGDIGESLNEWVKGASRERILEKHKLANEMLDEINQEITVRKKLGENEKELFPLRYDVDGIRSVLEHKLMTEPTAIATPGPAMEAKPGESTQGAIAAPGPPLGPSTAPAASAPLTPKSQRQIITDIAKGLKLPIRFGRLTTNKFAGYFKEVANLIGSRKADDIPIVSHEAGHKLDSTFGLSKDPSLISELDVLGDPATPGSRSSWTKSKTKKYKLGEGVAEFVRHWLTDPTHAQRVAPNTFTAFERALDTNKDFGDTMRQAQQDIALWRSADPQARLRSQISVGENPNKTRYTASQLTRDLVDDLHILRLATLDAAPKGTKLDPSADPYLLARNLRGSYGMASTFIRDGVVDFKTKEVRMGTGLEDALKPVAGRLNDFRDWIVAKRAQELRSQGRESGLVSTDVDAVAAKFDKDPEFQRAFTAVKNWNDALLRYAVDADLIQQGTPRTPEHGPTGAFAIREMNQDYVPFHRVFEIGAGESPSQSPAGIGMGLNVGKPGSLKQLHGSTRQIVDPLETMVKNAYTIITASEKAAINTAVADLSKLPDMGKWVERIATPKERVPVELEKIKKQLEAAGADLTKVPDDLLMDFFRQSRSSPYGENIIRVVRNGKAEFYRLNKELHDTFQALDLEDTGKLLRMLAAPSQLLRAGVTLDPAFSLANVMRDTFSAAVIGKYGAFPFETTFKGVAAMVNNPKLVAEWAAAGGKSAVEASYFDRPALQKMLAERISKDLTPAERALIVTKSPLSALRWVMSAFEEATRIGEYKIAYEQLRKSGMPEGEARRQAAFEARDRQDFAKGGAKTKIVRHLAAFWNAGLQANVKLAQAFKERPVRTTLQGLAFITIPKLIEQAINWDDEDYWARKQWERDLFFLIPIGKDKSGHTRFLRIPTPFEVGVIFGTLPGRMLQSMREKDPEAMKDFPGLMLKQSVPNPIPQAGQVVFEAFLSGKKGWDVWRGRTIVPESLADEPPELQYTEQTSGIAKKAGEVVGFSPMKIDHLIERTTGGMGKLVTGRSVPGQRFVTAPLSVSNQATETFYDRLEAIREDAARAKAENKSMPAGYAAFQSTERTLSALRKKVRETKDLDQKARLQEQMLKITTDFLKNHPKP